MWPRKVPLESMNYHLLYCFTIMPLSLSDRFLLISRKLFWKLFFNAILVHKMICLLFFLHCCGIFGSSNRRKQQTNEGVKMHLSRILEGNRNHIKLLYSYSRRNSNHRFVYDIIVLFVPLSLAYLVCDDLEQKYPF